MRAQSPTDAGRAFLRGDRPRQIPYAIGQFTVNEFCHELAFRNMSEETKRNLSGPAKFSISLGSGVIAGFAAAILSQVGKFLCLRSCNAV